MVNGGMSEVNALNTRTGRLSQSIVFAILFFGIAVRVWNQLGEPRLWLDEVFSVAIAESPPLDVLLATLRFDTHPPLYYLQLHVWSMFSQSDFWYILNSVVWSLLSLWVMFRTVKAVYGKQVGLWAAAIFAIFPLGYFFAENVRMYAFVAVLQILLWGEVEAQLRSQVADIRRYAIMSLLAVAITLSHGLGFFVVFFCFLQAGIRELMVRGAGRLIPLALSVAPAVLCAAWPILIGSFRQTEGVPGFDLSHIGIHLTLTTLGMGFPAPEIAGFLVISVIALLCLQMPKAQVQIVWLVLLPFTLLLLLSLFVKPVFIYRTLGLFLPYLAISMAICAESIFNRGSMAARIAFGAVLVVMVASGLNYALHFEKNGYSAIVSEWDQIAASDALVVVDHPVDLWALQRYLPDGERFSALEVQPPVRDGMSKLKQRLEGTPLDQLEFFGRADFREVGGRILAFAPTAELLAGRDLVWIMNPKSGCDEINSLIVGEGTFEPADFLSAQGETIIACRRKQ